MEIQITVLCKLIVFPPSSLDRAHERDTTHGTVPRRDSVSKSCQCVSYHTTFHEQEPGLSNSPFGGGGSPLPTRIRAWFRIDIARSFWRPKSLVAQA